MRFLLRVMLMVFGLVLVVITPVLTVLRRDAMPPSWIAFVSEDYELYRMNPDGRGVVQLTHTSEREWYPTWSPDGRWIAYTTSLVYEDFNVYLIRANGTRSN